MKTLPIPSRVALFVSAIVLVLQISPARAGGDEETGGGNGRVATIGQLAPPSEPVRAPVTEECRICLRTYVHNPAWPDGREMIREECGFRPTTLLSMRARQLQIATEGTSSWRNWEDWGTWYGSHRIESVQPALEPSCY